MGPPCVRGGGGPVGDKVCGMSRTWRVLLVVSLVVNLLGAAALGLLAREQGAHNVLESAGLVEPRRPAFDFYATERFEGLPGQGVVLVGDSHVERGPWSELLGRPVAVRGQFGQMIYEVAASLDVTLDGKAEAVVVWAGSNDVMSGRSLGQIEADMADLLERIGPQTRVVVLSIPPLVGFNSEVEAANDTIRLAADRAGATFVDVTEPLRGKLAHDGVHLTADGYKSVSDALAQVLRSP